MVHRERRCHLPIGEATPAAKRSCWALRGDPGFGDEKIVRGGWRFKEVGSDRR
jgi:hypothetical protein